MTDVAKMIIAFGVRLGAILGSRTTADASEPTAVRIGDRLELPVDGALIERITGTRLQLHRPTPREVGMVHDVP